MFSIRLGVPEMELRWTDLCEKAAGKLAAAEKRLHKRWGKAMALLASDQRHPGLNSHEIGPLSRRYGERVWQSYLENRNQRAAQMYWISGPNKTRSRQSALNRTPKTRRAQATRK